MMYFNPKRITSSGKLLLLLLLVAVCLTGCKTSRSGSSSSLPQEVSFLSSKVKLTVPHKGATLTVSGTMKLKGGECMQLSFLMPILRTEVARLEITPHGLILVDRMGKRYVQLSRKEVKRYLPKKTDFASLEKMLYNASKPGAKRELAAKDLGLPSIEKAKIELWDFSNKEFSITPTQITSKYKKVELHEILELLMSL